jgi:hypothetical protein
MRSVRDRLSLVLAVVLTLQFAGIMAPAVVGAADLHSAAACTCPGGEHATTCPMHHSTTGADHPASQCTMTNAAAPLDVALLTLASGAGVLPSRLTLDLAERRSPAFTSASPVVVSRVDFPDSPPPRA